MLIPHQWHLSQYYQKRFGYLRCLSANLKRWQSSSIHLGSPGNVSIPFKGKKNVPKASISTEKFVKEH